MTKGLAQNKQLRNAIISGFFKSASSTSLFKMEQKLDRLNLNRKTGQFVRDYLRFVEKHRNKKEENFIKVVKKFIRVYHQKLKKFQPDRVVE